jgi:hypothetical protein
MGLFGTSPKEKQRQKERRERLDKLEAESEKDVEAAYIEAKKQRRIENAKTAGVRDADGLVNQKPFYQKLMGGASWLIKDLSEGAANVNPDALFTFDDPKPKRKRRRRN